MPVPIIIDSHPDDFVVEYLAARQDQLGTAWTVPTVQEIAEATGLPMNRVRRQLKAAQQHALIDADLRPCWQAPFSDGGSL